MSAKATLMNLTSGRLLARSAVWNMVGQLLPAAIAVFAIPVLVHGIGVERFGLLSLAWVVVGYFSLFDLGIGRALTKLVADKLGLSDHNAIPALAGTSLLLLLLLGVMGGLIAAAMTPWLVHSALKVPLSLRREALPMFYMLAAAIPLITVTSGMRGILEALQHFRILTLIRLPISVLSFMGPVLVLPFSHSLVPMVAVLVAGRLMGMTIHLVACLNAMPTLRRASFDWKVVPPVISFGGWMTLSNLVSPLMVYMDRFLIGSLLSVAAIAYYTAPLDMITRLLLIPTALTGVLFPALTVTLAQKSERANLLASRAEKYIYLAVFPLVLTIVTLAPDALRLWLGDAFARNGAVALRWLAVGVFINCLAQVPYVLIQSAGRPDISTKIQIGELPFYLAGLWFLTRHFGVDGAAIAWSSRAMVDGALMFSFANRLVPRARKGMLKLTAATMLGIALFAAMAAPMFFATKCLVLVLLLITLAFIGWAFVLDSGEQLFIRNGRKAIASAMPFFLRIEAWKN